jgi:serine/threonine protein kinase
VTQEEWRRVWGVLRSTAELPAEDRAAFLESSLPDGPLREKAWELLAEEYDSDPRTSPLQPEPPSGAPVPTPEWQLLAKSISRFEILAPIGRGGMGEVYRAFDPELGRHVAIKCIAPSRLGAPAALSAFVHEARSASALNHPGIVTVYEVIRSKETVAIVMELVEGDSLRNLTGSPQPVKRVAAWGELIAEGLAASHARGIIHRDIKPENLILRSDGYIKILDFGLATDHSVAVDTLPMGTLRYMSPEQTRGAELTTATDVFSLGIVLYELATGVHPFASGAEEGNSTLTVVHAIAESNPLPLSSVAKTLPPWFTQLVDQMIAKRASERPSGGRYRPTTVRRNDRRAIRNEPAQTLCDHCRGRGRGAHQYCPLWAAFRSRC